MAAIDLVFARPPLTTWPIALVFGDGDSPLIDAIVSIAVPLPGLSGSAAVVQGIPVAIAAALPTLGGAVGVTYKSGTQRPVVGHTAVPWQQAAPLEIGVHDGPKNGSAAPAGASVHWSRAAALRAMAAGRLDDGAPVSAAAAAMFQDALQLGANAIVQLQDAQHDRRLSRATVFADAAPAGFGWRNVLEDGRRDRRLSPSTTWRTAQPAPITYATAIGSARKLRPVLRTRFQDARRASAGTYVGPQVSPPATGCYLPPAGHAVALVFSKPWTGFTGLLFSCDANEQPASVVVPVRKVYMTVNNLQLRRVDGNVAVPALTFSLSVDADSWTWSWSATLPREAQATLAGVISGEPVELEATINGVAYRLLAESMARDREFAKTRIRVQGRGLASVLDAPYAPVLNFANTQPRTAQQLMADVLTINGVSLGWAIDWQLTDWLVPADTWAHQGSYISALGAIAAAAGGYLQPHATAKTLRVLPRYPLAPWHWLDQVGGLMPDYELPSALTTREGITWARKPTYNRVYVSGVKTGVQGQVTRAGTAGDELAPMVTDPLITHADAARQRGLAILSDTGAQAMVSLRLPVLAETGIILPGSSVRYVDGNETMLGIVRGTALEWNRPTLRQTLEVQTHG